MRENLQELLEVEDLCYDIRPIMSNELQIWCDETIAKLVAGIMTTLLYTFLHT